MASSVKNIEVSQVGACLKVLVLNAVNPNPHEIYALSNIKGVTGSFQANVGRNGIANPSTYPFTDRKIVVITFTDDKPPLIFDLETVSNQVGWTLNLAGVIQAITDINSWITTVVTPSGGATETTLQSLLTELQLKADLTEAQLVSAAALPLPIGASTEATLAAILAKIIAAPSTSANQVLEIAKLNDALGGDGTEFIFVSTGAVSSKTYKYLVANEDCTFTTLTGSVTADLKATLGIAANTVSKGMIIRGLNGETVTAVTMLTGSVIGIR